MAKEVVSEVRPRFVPRKSVYSPFRDNQEVDQFGFINLADSFEKGIIPGGVELTDQDFNGVSNPGTLISHAFDVFDGLRKVNYVKSCLDRLNAEERERVEAAMQRANEKSGVTPSAE